MKISKKLLSIILAITMVLSYCTIIDADTDAGDIYVSVVATSNSSGTTGISSVTSGNDYYLAITLSNVPKTSVVNSVTNLSMVISYDTSLVSVSSIIQKASGTLTKNLTIGTDVMALAWANTDGFTDEEDALTSEGLLAVIKLHALQDLGEADLTKIEFLASYDTPNGVRKTQAFNGEDNGGRPFNLVFVPAISDVTLADPYTLYTSADAAAIKAAVASFTFIGNDGAATTYTSANATEWGNMTITPPDTIVEGENTATLTYEGKTKTFTFNASAVALDHIAITTQPTKLTYTYPDKLDLSGMVVTAYNTDSTNSVVSEGLSYSIGETAVVSGETVLTVADSGKKVTVTYSGKTTDTAVLTVNAKDVASPTITIDPSTYVYSGSAIVPTSVVVKDGEVVIDPSEYSLAYSDNVAVGTTAKVTVSDVSGGNYNITETDAYFTITGKAITLTMVSDIDPVDYNGSAQEPAVTVTDGTTVLTKDTDYTVEYGNNTNAGAAIVTVSGIGNYNGAVTKNFTINAKALTDDMVQDISAVNYDGTAKTPAVTVTGLTENTDYTLAYGSNTNAGTAIVTVSGIGNYNGTVTKNFTINKIDATLTVGRVGGATGDIPYDAAVVTAGKDAVTGDFTYSYNGDGEITVTWYADNAGVKGSALQGAPKDAGTYWIGVSAAAGTNYNAAAEVTATFTIAKTSETKTDNTLSAITVAKGFGTFTDPTFTSSLGETLTGTLVYTIGGNEKTHDEVVDYLKTKDLGNVNDVTYQFTVASDNPNYSGTISGTIPFTVVDIVFDKSGGIAVAADAVYGAAWSDIVTWGAITASVNGVAKAGTYRVVDAADSTVTVPAAGSQSWKILFTSTDGTYTDIQVDSGTTTITAKALTTSDVTITLTTADNLTYNGSAKQPDTTVKFGTLTLVKGTDYDVTYENNTNAGTAKAKIAFKGNYSGNAEKEFTISAKALTTSDVTIADITGLTYSGSEQTPTPVISYGAVALISGTDYELSYNNNINAGTGAKVTFTFKGNYSGSAEKTFTIGAKALTSSDVTIADITGLTYNGSAQTPTPAASYGAVALVNGTDYTLSYQDNTNAGTSAKVTFEFKGNYSGSVDKTFTISPKTVTATIDTIADQVFSGSAITPAVVVKDGETVIDSAEYTVGYSDNINVGTATVTITDNADGNYTVSGSTTFKINPKTVTATIDAIADQVFSGSAIEPAVTVRDGETVIDSAEYTVGYGSNINAGTATVTITDNANGNYTVSGSTTFKITPKTVTATIDAIADQVFSGSAIEPAVVAKDGETTIPESEYTVGYSNNTNAGTATVTLTDAANGNYTVSGSTTFVISPKAVTATIDAIDDQVYTANAIEPTVVVKDGTTVIDSAEYTVSYSSNTNVGEATVTVTDNADGNYTVTGSTTFNITAAALTVEDLEAADRKYVSGNTTATLSNPGTLVGVLGTDDVSLTIVSAEFEDDAIGVDKNVTVTVELAGTKKDNYVLNQTVYVVKASIMNAQAEVKPAETTVDTSTAEVTTSGSAVAGDATDAANALGTTTPGKDLDVDIAGAANDIAASEDIADDLSGALQALDQAAVDVTGLTEADVSIVIVPEIQASIKMVEATDDGGHKLTSITYEITAVCNKYAMPTSELSNPIVTEGAIGNATNAALISSEVITNLKSPIEMKIPVPAGFIDPALDVFVKHVHNGKNYQYKATYDSGNLLVCFTNPHGFSEFTVVQTSESVASVDNGVTTVYFNTLADAIEYLSDGDTLTILAGKDAGSASVGKEISFTVVEEAGSSATITAAGGYAASTQTVAGGTKYTITVAPPSNPQQPATYYTITVEKNANCDIKVGADKAAVAYVISVEATPKDGYELVAIKAMSGDNEITVRKNADGTYDFVMPEGNVVVSAEVKLIENEDNPDEPFENPFTDVKEGAWYYDAVMWAAGNGITNGVTATTFAPGNFCSREEVVTFLYRAAGSPNYGGENPFTDVVYGTYYYNAVLWAADNGITKGISATKFGVGNICSRAEIVTFLARFAKGTAKAKTSKFTDVPAGEYYTNAVIWAEENKVTKGTSATTFSPKGLCTRAEVVTFLYRAVTGEGKE